MKNSHIRFALAAALTIPVLLLVAAICGGTTSGLVMGGLVLAAGGIFWGGITRRAKALEVRSRTTEGNKVWRIQLNDVPLGELSDAQYANLENQTLHDVEVVARQVANIGVVLFNVVKSYVAAVPLAAFWLLFMLALWDLPDLTRAVALMREASEKELAQALQLFVSVVAMAAFLGLAALLFVGHTFGMRDCYEEALSKRVRYHLRATAPGLVGAIGFDEQGSLGTAAASAPVAPKIEPAEAVSQEAGAASK